MKKFKIVFIFTVLLVSWVGLFAWRSPNAAGLYIAKGGSGILLANSVDASALQTTANGSQCAISGSAGIFYPVYGQSTLTSPLYEISFGW